MRAPILPLSNHLPSQRLLTVLVAPGWGGVRGREQLSSKVQRGRVTGREV